MDSGSAGSASICWSMCSAVTTIGSCPPSRSTRKQTTPGIQLQSDYATAAASSSTTGATIPAGRGAAAITSRSIDVLGHPARRLFVRTSRPGGAAVHSVFQQRRVIALRGRVEATSPRDGNRVPFYLQPTLGGSEDLRGFRPFRFYDNNAVILNGEYRWEVFSGLDMALFVDAGRVFHEWQQINYRNLETDAGFGFRFNVAERRVHEDRHGVQPRRISDMGQVQQRVLAAGLLFIAAGLPLAAQRFYPDDPLMRDPKPLPVGKLLSRSINEYYDFFQNTFFEPDKELKKHHTPGPSEAVTTLGEVPDSAWFTNRHLTHRSEMVKGPGTSRRARDRQAVDGSLRKERGRHSRSGDQGFRGTALFSEVRSEEQSGDGERRRCDREQVLLRPGI